MDAQALGLGLAVVLPLLGGGVWLIRLEGRVNVQEALHRELRDDLKYVRDRIDKALNGHGDAR